MGSECALSAMFRRSSPKRRWWNNEGTIFFCLFILACRLSGLWRRTFYPGIPSPVRAVLACCNLPFALRAGNPYDRIRTKETTKETSPGVSSGQMKETKESAVRPLGSLDPRMPWERAWVGTAVAAPRHSILQRQSAPPPPLFVVIP